MEIVINIDDELYEKVRNAHKGIFIDIYKMMVKAILHGTPLPKGHGDLKDAEIVWDKLKGLEEYYQKEFLKKSNAIHESAMGGRLYGFTTSKFIVQDAPTIIEADKEAD